MTNLDQKGADPARPAPEPGPVRGRFINVPCAAHERTLRIPPLNVTIWAVSWKPRNPDGAQWDPIPGPPGTPAGEAAGDKKRPRG